MVLLIAGGKNLIYIMAACLFLQYILILIILFWALLIEVYKRLVANNILYHLFLRIKGFKNNIILTLVKIAK